MDPPHILIGMSDDAFAFRALFGAVLKAPRVWAEALRAAVAVVPRRWWATTSHLPLPDGTYLAWRAHTAYGAGPIDHEDFVPYLEWRKRQRNLRV